MKKLLALFMIAILALISACGENEKPAEKASVEVEANENTEETDNEDESVHRESNINLDDFIESYNKLAEDAGIENLERDGNESIAVDGLLIKVNDDGTVWGIVQPTGTSPFVLIATLLAIEEQSSEEDSDKIYSLLEEFAEAIDNEDLFVEDLAIESMTININVAGADFITFNVLGDEKS